MLGTTCQETRVFKDLKKITSQKYQLARLLKRSLKNSIVSKVGHWMLSHIQTSFLLNSKSVPQSWNVLGAIGDTNREKQELDECRSQNDPNSEVGCTENRSTHTVIPQPNTVHHNNHHDKPLWWNLCNQKPSKDCVSLKNFLMLKWDLVWMIKQKSSKLSAHKG